MVSKRIVLKFPKKIVDKPIICKLVKDYNLEFSILHADFTPNEEGLLVLELTGESKDYNHGIEYLKELGIKIQLLSQDVKRNEKRCTHCGVCISICPAGALISEPKTKKVLFHDKKCIACGICIKICPPRAMELHF